MKMKFRIILAILLVGLAFVGCKKDYPVDEDGLLVTTRQECYVSSFELLGTDYVSVRTKNGSNRYYSANNKGGSVVWYRSEKPVSAIQPGNRLQIGSQDHR
jgi:hypothetical protein